MQVIAGNFCNVTNLSEHETDPPFKEPTPGPKETEDKVRDKKPIKVRSVNKKIHVWN